MRDARELVFSSVVAGELLAGFRQGSRLPENLSALRRFLASPRVTLVSVSWTTADRYGRLFAALKARGAPIPTNDLWIAAHALETGADLVSFDRHFGSIDGLAWVDPGPI